MTKKYECGYTTQHYFKVGEYVDVKIVIALRDIPEHNVKKGDEGGCIESEANLSQKGNCWVGKTGIVYGKTTKVKDDALVEGYVHDGAVVGGKVRIARDSVASGSISVEGDFTVNGWLVESPPLLEEKQEPSEEQEVK